MKSLEQLAKTMTDIGNQLPIDTELIFTVNSQIPFKSGGVCVYAACSTPDGYRYRTRVIQFFPTDAEEAIKRIIEQLVKDAQTMQRCKAPRHEKC